MKFRSMLFALLFTPIASSRPTFPPAGRKLGRAELPLPHRRSAARRAPALPHGRRADGEPVLVLHGTTQSGAAMLAPTFGGELFGAGQPLDAKRYYIILPDSLGHGRSSKPSDGMRAKFRSTTTTTWWMVSTAC
jgi:pimeloyl-ACP methyl ester carboxylesterase